MNAVLGALLRSNFLLFARKALWELEGVKLGDEPYLKHLAHELQQFANGDTRRLIINLPPGHLKTSLSSVCLAAWLLAHDPSLKLIVVSHCGTPFKIDRTQNSLARPVCLVQRALQDANQQGSRRSNRFRYRIGRRRLCDIVSGRLHRPACERDHRR